MTNTRSTLVATRKSNQWAGHSVFCTSQTFSPWVIVVLLQNFKISLKKSITDILAKSKMNYSANNTKKERGIF